MIRPGRWREVTKREPCPACEGGSWCAWSPSGEVLKCERSTIPPPGLELVKVKDGGGLFQRSCSGGDVNGRNARRGRTAAHGSVDWKAETERFRLALTDEHCEQLARSLNVLPESLRALDAGWACRADLVRLGASGEGWQENYPDGAYAFPERDGSGRIVGIGLRAEDGRKGFLRGGRRGLTIPADLLSMPGPRVVVEGPSDVAACLSVGVAAVGRPSNTGGSEHLALFLKGEETLIAGERDPKRSGQWPGRAGAISVARRLATELREPVRWTLPPVGHKDVRAWLGARIAAGLDLADEDARNAAGQELLAAFAESAKEEAPERKPAKSELLVRLALERYRLGVSTEGEPFAVEVDGPNVALMFRGSGEALRSALAVEFRRRYQTVPNASALADALVALTGMARESEPEPVHLRVAEHGGAIILDLGDPQGRAVRIGPGEWAIEARSPVLFRRTALTAPLPEPERGGSLDPLWGLLNVTPEDRDLLLGWLLSAYLPTGPRVILLLGGEQGTGKTTAGRFLASLFDPSHAPTRSEPRDPEQWAVSVAASWCAVVDNVSTISAWWSDALCKSSTGDGWIRRKLYSDSDIAVLSFRRVVILTSIDAGALRGDLGDRILLADLARISEEARRTEADLEAAYREDQPRILGAVLDLLARVLEQLPHTSPTRLPRMADFGRLLAALDAVGSTDAYERFLEQSGRLAREVVDDDPVATEVERLMSSRECWAGTAGELLRGLEPEDPPKGWPKSPRSLSARLRRLAPALGAIGIEVTPPSRTDKTRQWNLCRTAQTARPSEPSLRISGENREGRAVHRAVEESSADDRPSDEPNATDPQWSAGPSGDLGGPSPSLSLDELEEAREEREAIQHFDGELDDDDEFGPGLFRDPPDYSEH